MDYSKIEWSKLPELPDGLRCRLLVNELQVLKNGYVNAKRLDHDGSEWRFHCELRRHLEMAFAATDIIDRFIAEQEAELQKHRGTDTQTITVPTGQDLIVQVLEAGTMKAIWSYGPVFFPSNKPIKPKPKPRRVTPKELLVELIQTGKALRVSPLDPFKQRVFEFRWNQISGLQDHREGVDWGGTNIEWFSHFQFFDIIDVGKPRLPVKTKAPEGCRWDFAIPLDGLRAPNEIALYRRNGECLRVPKTQQEANEMRALADACLELNPAT